MSPTRIYATPDPNDIESAIEDERAMAGENLVAEVVRLFAARMERVALSAAARSKLSALQYASPTLDAERRLRLMRDILWDWEP